MNTEKHFKLSYKVQINTCFFRQFDERIEMVNAHRLQEIRSVSDRVSGLKSCK